MKRMTMAAALALVAACQTGEAPAHMAARIRAESDTAKTQIRQVNEAFMRYMTTNQPDSLVALYTERATVMAPNAPSVIGRDAIRQGFVPMMGAGVRQFQLVTETVAANGTLAVERGRYRLELGPATGRPVAADSGKYMVEWHKVDGRWMLHNDIWNSDAPERGR